MKFLIHFIRVISVSLVVLISFVQQSDARRIAVPEDVISRNIGWFFREGKQFSDDIAPALFEKYSEKQTPEIMCVCCADSRAPLVWEFNSVFKVCTAGNTVFPVKGTVKYGRDILKIPVAIVVGHSDCGAIKAAMGGTEGLPAKIKEEIDLFVVDSSKTLNENIIENVHRQIAMLMDVKDDVERAFIGVVYDHSNDFGKGYGAWIVVNVNGQTDPPLIKKHLFLQNALSEVTVLD